MYQNETLLMLAEKKLKYVGWNGSNIIPIQAFFILLNVNMYCLNMLEQSANMPIAAAKLIWFFVNFVMAYKKYMTPAAGNALTSAWNIFVDCKLSISYIWN